MQTTVMQNKKINLPYKYLTALSYLYILLPIIIFFIGWLKTGIGLLFSGIVLIGLLYILKDQYKSTEVISLSSYSIIIIIAVISIWVYCAGIGGFWPQQADWHWRNAILRDLIDYSWPVVYPETDNALVYYMLYFLIPALAGKILGWSAANVILLIWTILGISICILLLCRYFKIDNTKLVIAILIIFVTWRGFDDIRNQLANVLGTYDLGYQYSPNNTLLEWVTNQTITPWVATLLFLNNRKINNYAYLGLCVLASAPLPFVGMFLLLVADGMYKYISEYKKNTKKWLADVLSIQNIGAVISIFPVFGLYYASNMAANGSGGKGGFGLYILPEDFTMLHLLALILFWFFNFLIFSIIIYL